MILGLCGQAGAGKDTVADFLVKNHGFVKVAFADPLKRICKDVFDFSDEQLWGPSSERNKPDPRYVHSDARRRKHLYDETHPGPLWRCSLCGLVACRHDFGSTDCPKGSFSLDPLLACLTPRYALQQLGTEWGRACCPGIWVEYALRVASRLMRNNTRYSAKLGELSGGTNIRERVPKGVVIPDVRFLNEVDAIRAGGGQVWKIERPGAGLSGSAAQHASEQEQNGIDQGKFASVLNNGDGPLEDLEALVRKELSALRFIYPNQE